MGGWEERTHIRRKKRKKNKKTKEREGEKKDEEEKEEEEGKKKKLIITFGNSWTLFVSCKLPQVDSSYVDGDKNFSRSQTFSYFLAFCNARFSLVM